VQSVKFNFSRWFSAQKAIDFSGLSGYYFVQWFTKTVLHKHQTISDGKPIAVSGERLGRNRLTCGK